MQRKNRYITFSLWGDNPKYTEGAVRNAELALKVYPGWIAKFYVGKTVDNSVLLRLVDYGAEVVKQETPGDWSDGLFWRFLDASNPDCEVMISRDCDSRLNYREAHAVEEWLGSNKPFHIMRDHPHHNTAILGGMWGVRDGFLSDMHHWIKTFKAKNGWGTDQDFLKTIVFPIIKDHACIHDMFSDTKPFPTPRKGIDYVGQIFDHNDNPVPHARDLFVPYPKMWKVLHKTWKALKSKF